MKTQRTSAIKRGFTLMELMVAMAITSIIVTVLVYVTSIALDTWNRSRSELRATRQAKSMIDAMARDFESLVTRKGNTSEWLSAVVDPDLGDLGAKAKSTNASKLIFFTAATDRYNGQIGNATTDKGGDVSCVAYQLKYRDPMENDPDKQTGFETFVLNRLVVDPNYTFDDFLGKTDLVDALSKPPTKPGPAPKDKIYSQQLSESSNFVCENVFQFSVTFHVRATQTTGTVVNVPVMIGEPSADKKTTFEKFAIQGTGMKAYKNKDVEPAADSTVDVAGTSIKMAELASGRITAMEVSVTVLSDFGVEQAKKRNFTTDAQKAEFLAKNSYQFSKLIQLTSM